MSQPRKHSYLTNSKRDLVAKDLSESMGGKLPPMAVDMEEGVLGAVLLERSAITRVIEVLKPEDFYLEKHNIIYSAAIELFRADQPIDMRTVVDQLRRNGMIDLVGGAYQIADLSNKVSSSANIEYHARVIAEMAIKRRLIRMSSEIHNQSYDETTDVFVVLERAQQRFDEVSGLYLKGNVKTAKEVYEKATQTLLAARDKKGLTGVPSGYAGLDRLIAGWQKTELTIIAGRPGMGKTAFVTNVLRNAAVDFKVPVAIFSLEMSDLQLMQRMKSAESEVELEKIIHGTYSDSELNRIINMTGRLASAPIFIDDTASLSILELRAKCRRLKAENNIQLVVVDYLQLMRGDENAGNREQEISSISRALKGIAKDLDVPVLALSQLSRGVEQRGGDKRPQLADLRESGSIEQDADKVIFLYRPEYYKITVYEDGSPTQGVMEAIIAKNRNGACDTIRVKFTGRISKIQDFDDFSVPSAPSPQIPSNFKSYKSNQVSRREHDDGIPPPNGSDETPF